LNLVEVKSISIRFGLFSVAFDGRLEKN